MSSAPTFAATDRAARFDALARASRHEVKSSVKLSPAAHALDFTTWNVNEATQPSFRTLGAGVKAPKLKARALVPAWAYAAAGGAGGLLALAAHFAHLI